MSAADTDAAISGYVLAGGVSSRLGRDKVLLPFPLMGGTLLDHAIARLQQVCGSVCVCGNRPELREHLPPGVEIIPDAFPGCGPLGGIVAALEGSQTDWNLLLAVDLPLVPTEFLQRLIASATGGRPSASQALCILPLVENLPQPLCSMYHRSLAFGLQRALEEGKYKIMHALRDAAKHIAPQKSSSPSVEYDDTRSAHIDANRIKFLDIHAFTASQHPNSLMPKNWFININTEADLLRARELVRHGAHTA